MNRLLSISLLGVVALAACADGEAVETEGFATVTTSTGDLEILVEASGSIEPVRNVEVKSLASGEITRLYVDVGDEVQPGDLLAEVDPRDVRTAYRQAEADLGVAEARVEISRTQLRRSEDLFAAGVITEQEVENARLEYQNTEAQYIRTQSAFELAELRLNDVTIRAPLAGTILAKNVEEGAVIQSASGNVSGGSVLFQMAALEQMQVRTNIDETDVGKIREGLYATLTVEAYPNQDFVGQVLKVEPQAVVSSNVVQFPVIITLDNSAGLLKPGMNAEVEILIDRANGVMTVPNIALYGIDDVKTVAEALGVGEAELEAAGAGGGDYQGTTGATWQQGPRRSDRQRERDAALEDVQAADGAIIRTSSAYVFVLDETGMPKPREIVVGLTDYEDTQVISGLSPEDQIVILTPAQLRAQQQAAAEAQLNRRFGGSSSPFGR
jgi:HlyD family secretion protein